MSFEIINHRRRIVRICKDVIAQVNAQMIRANVGVEIRLNGIFVAKKHSDPEFSAQEYFKNKPCDVCARGAMAIAFIRRHNSVRIGLIKQSDISRIDSISNFFSQELLDCMEAAFEARTYDWHLVRSNSRNFINFFYAYEEDKIHHPEKWNDCLIAIMNNIIENKGQFVFNGVKAGK